ncbi:MAG: hypothetical protein JWR72_1900 [Flavisolibacter sp.]|jgi:hypothetical protein|nr:hypothetical protein [Flavisolibacter sp.]
MNPISLFGLTSIACFGLPILVILAFRLYRHASLIALLLYYVLTIVHCLNAESIPPVPNFQSAWDVAYSYVEIPLMLSALLFFCPAKLRQQKMHNIIIGFIIFEVMVSLYYKFTPEATIYITAPGLLIIVLYTGFLFLRQAKFTFIHGKNAGRLLMLGGMLFSYSCYLFVFYAYFIQHQTDVAGIYYVYFVASTIASALVSVGLFMMRHRIKELQELKVVRKELQMYFGSL